MIPILNLTRQYDALKASIDEALLQVAASGHYILGPEVSRFEAEMAQYLGVPHVIGCASGTDALFLALRALNIGEGDEVITTPFSFVATSEAIARTGAKPVFVDIEPDTLNMDVSLLEAALTPKTRAILPVHLFGQPADMDEIRRFAAQHQLHIVEDCAQAIGAVYNTEKVGALGDIGCFSFFPSKNLGALGDAGMCVTRDAELADRLRMLRVHGSRQRYYHDQPGLNSRLDEIQAAVLRVKLPHLDGWNRRRVEVADRYDTLLKPLEEFLATPERCADTEPVFHQYTIRIKGPEPAARRDAIRQRLEEAGIQTMVYYPLPLYRQRTHAGLGLEPTDFPVCEDACARVLSLPIFPELTGEEQETVVTALKAAFAREALPV